MSLAKSSEKRWSRLLWIIPVAVTAVVGVVLAAKGLRTLPAVQDFLITYPGEVHLPVSAPVGFPAWLAWQHFLNAFFLLLIIRTGWIVRTTQRPAAHWTRTNNGLIRTKNPPNKISLDLWLHLCVDALWLLNGIIFVVLLFVSGQWMRVVPTDWAVLPNALSAALQYASLVWPVENGWVNYNSLQVLAYFTVIFVAAPLSVATGIRMSGAWPKQAKRLNRVYPVEVARAVHFPTMLFIVAFIIVHVTLVFATGALRNLNHMYAVQDTEGWTGLWYFLGSVIVMAVTWVAARPVLLRPIASLMGKVSR